MNQEELGQLRIFEAELKAALLYKNWVLLSDSILWLEIFCNRAERELDCGVKVVEVEFAGGPVGENS